MLRKVDDPLPGSTPFPGRFFSLDTFFSPHALTYLNRHTFPPPFLHCVCTSTYMFAASLPRPLRDQHQFERCGARLPSSPFLNMLFLFLIPLFLHQDCVVDHFCGGVMSSIYSSRLPDTQSVHFLSRVCSAFLLCLNETSRMTRSLPGPVHNAVP